MDGLPGRMPLHLKLAKRDLPILQQIARSRQLPWFQVEHARIVLALAGGEAVQSIAWRMECDRTTIWRIARRYQQCGLEPLLSEQPRCGAPPQFSPLAAGPDCASGLPGTHRQRPAHHPLGQR